MKPHCRVLWREGLSACPLSCVPALVLLGLVGASSASRAQGLLLLLHAVLVHEAFPQPHRAPLPVSAQRRPGPDKCFAVVFKAVAPFEKHRTLNLHL